MSWLEFLKSIPLVTGPISLFCFVLLAIIAAILEARKKPKDRTFNFIFRLCKLFTAKLTKEQLFQILSKTSLSLLRGLFWLILIAFVFVFTVFVLAMRWNHEDSVITLDVFVHYNGQPVTIEYELDYRTQELGVKTAPKPVNGHTEIRGYPRKYSSLDVKDLRIDGYDRLQDQKYPIVESQVIIDVTSNGPKASSLKITDIVDVNGFKPTEDELKELPPVQSNKVLLTYRNKTNEYIWILLYNWGKDENSFTRLMRMKAPPDHLPKLSPVVVRES